jgi:hypothetical protein
MHRYTVLFEDRQATRIQGLASQYGLTEQEVLRQLVELGLDHLDDAEAVADSDRT